MRTKKQHPNMQRNRFGSLLFLLALVTGAVSCGGGDGGSKPLPTTIPQLTLVQVECRVIGFGDLIKGGPDEGPYRKVLYKYWSDGTSTEEISDQTDYKPSCP